MSTKKILGAVLGLGLFATSAYAVETGFDVGNTFSWQTYEGRVWVSCGIPRAATHLTLAKTPS